MGTDKIILLGCLLVINLLSFAMMGYDKRCAQQGRRRVPEKTLFLFAALFGAAGGTAGMWLFRHKTKHMSFRILFPLMLLLQAAVAGYAFVRWL